MIHFESMTTSIFTLSLRAFLIGQVSDPRGQGDLLLLDQRCPRVETAETHPCVLVEDGARVKVGVLWGQQCLFSVLEIRSL